MLSRVLTEPFPQGTDFRKHTYLFGGPEGFSTECPAGMPDSVVSLSIAKGLQN